MVRPLNEPPHPPPPSKRVSVSQTILQLLYMNVSNPASFPFPSPPSAASIKTALMELKLLEAVEAAEEGEEGGGGGGGRQTIGRGAGAGAGGGTAGGRIGSQGSSAPAPPPRRRAGLRLTAKGRAMAALPVDPVFSSLLLLACCEDHPCTEV